MPVRATMATLISKTRLLINDAGSTTWTDQQVQDILDQSRTDVIDYPLTSSPTYAGDYLDHYADVGDWEDGSTFLGSGGVSITPSTLEPLLGHWKFSTSQLPPVLLTGRYFDVYCAAADLLEMQAAQLSMSYDITVDGQTLKRSQMADALRRQASNYRQRQFPKVVTMVRDDLNPTTCQTWGW